MTNSEDFVQMGQLAVPLLAPGPQPTLLGTAFFVRLTTNDTWLVTARHVVEISRKIVVGRLGIAPDGARGARVEIEQVAVADGLVSDDLDIALLRVPGRWHEATIRPFGSWRSISAQYLNLEFSQSIRRPALLIQPSHNLGHAARREWRDDFRTGKPMEALVFSWAAYKGASGSPVWDMGPAGTADPRLAAMIIQNVEAELLPAHFEEIVDEGGRSKRHVYFAPNAIGIAFPHLEAFATAMLGSG